MLIYATPADLMEWTGATDVPDQAIGLLRAASLAVREVTSLCFYATDSTGMPTDADILQAFNDATCAHATWLSTEGVDTNLGGTLSAGVEDSVGIGSARISYADAGEATAAKRRALDGVCPDAMRILRGVGIFTTAPWIVG